MAKRTTSRLEMRKMAEAAESQGRKGEASDVAPSKKKSKEPKDPKAKKTATRTKRSKAKVIVRKRMVWGVFSSSMKEEGRFPYADRAAADARAEELTLRHKRQYFVQGIKEPLPDKPAAVAEAE